MVELAAAGRLTRVEPAGGRVGGLLRPPAVARVLETVAVLAEFVPETPGRRAVVVVVVAVRFAAVDPAVFEAPAVASTGTSEC